MTTSLTERYWNLTEQQMQRLRYGPAPGDRDIPQSMRAPETIDEVRKRHLYSLDRWLDSEASSGRPMPLPPTEKRQNAFAEVAGQELRAKRSALAGCPMRLIYYARRYTFLAELPDRQLAAPRKQDWRIVSESEAAEPFWEDWWYPAHSPQAALAVLATTLVYYRRLAEAERQWIELVEQRRLPARPFDSVPQADTRK